MSNATDPTPQARADAEEPRIILSASDLQGHPPQVAPLSQPLQASAHAQPEPAKDHKTAKPSTRTLTDAEWETVDFMYLAGGRPADIAAHFSIPSGTIYTRITRKKLAQQREKFKAAATALAIPEGPQILADARKKFMGDMAEVVVEGAQVLKSQRPVNRRQVREQASAARELVEVAKPILGIAASGEGGTSVINLQFLASPGAFARPVSGSDKTVAESA